LKEEGQMRICSYIGNGSLIVLLWVIQANGESITRFDRLEVKELWVSETLKLKGAPISNDNADYEEELGELFAFRERISQLEAVIEEIRREMDSLKKIAESSRSKDLAAIRRFLKKGLTMDQVRNFLGEPEKTRADTWGTTWYYPQNRTVVFNGWNKKVSRWTNY
jgi:hypothetical protein